MGLIGQEPVCGTVVGIELGSWLVADREVSTAGRSRVGLVGQGFVMLLARWRLRSGSSIATAPGATAGLSSSALTGTIW